MNMRCDEMNFSKYWRAFLAWLPSMEDLAVVGKTHIVWALLGVIAGLLLSAVAFAQTAPTVTLTAAPSSGTSSVTPTLTWSSTGAANCTASGGWTGIKATSGSQAMPAVTATTVYNLACAAAGGTATLTWVPPTERTDGSALTNLAQYGIWTGPSATSLTRLMNIPSGGTSHTLNSMAAGVTFFSMTALDSVGLESDKANPVSKTVSIPSAATSATVTVNFPPKPPVLTAVTGTVAYELQLKGNGDIKLGRAVGTVISDTACHTYEWMAGYYQIAPSAVDFSRTPKSSIVVAVCVLA